MILASRDALAGGDVAETNLALTIIFPFIATIVVAGRFYARRLKRMTPGYDDWIMLLAIVLHLAQMSMGILRKFYIFGRWQEFTYTLKVTSRAALVSPPANSHHINLRC